MTRADLPVPHILRPVRWHAACSERRTDHPTVQLADLPPADVADALDALELDGPEADARDCLVTVLRTQPDDTEAIVMAAVGLWSNVNLADFGC